MTIANLINQQGKHHCSTDKPAVDRGDQKSQALGFFLHSLGPSYRNINFVVLFQGILKDQGHPMGGGAKFTYIYISKNIYRDKLHLELVKVLEFLSKVMYKLLNRE